MPHTIEMIRNSAAANNSTTIHAVSRVARAVEDHRSGRPGRDSADPARGASIQPARGGTRAGAGGCGAHEPHLVGRRSCASCAPDRCHRRGGRVGGSSAACGCALPRCDREAAGDRRADAGGCHGGDPIRPRLRVSSRAIGPAVSRCFLRRRGRESARPVGSESDRPVLCDPELLDPRSRTAGGREVRARRVCVRRAWSSRRLHGHRTPHDGRACRVAAPHHARLRVANVCARRTARPCRCIARRRGTGNELAAAHAACRAHRSLANARRARDAAGRF